MSTWRAFRPSGGRNAPTASETASMPVSDAPPLANARSRVKIITPVISPAEPDAETVGAGQRSGAACGRFPSTSRISPTMIIKMTAPENR